MLNSSKAICHFYKSSRGCKFGTNCRFSHSLPPDLSVETKNENGILNAQSQQPYSEAISNISSTRFESQEQDESVKKVTKPKKDLTYRRYKVCHYFYKYGNCKFGTKCKFVHTEEGQQVEPDEAARADEGASASNSEIKHHDLPASTVTTHAKETDVSDVRETDVAAKPRRKNRCKFFKAGLCKKGQDCRFRHNEEKANIQKNLKKEDSKSTDQGDELHVPLTSSIKKIDSSSQGAVQEKINTRSRPQFPASNVIRELRRENATDEEIDKMRMTELQQLKKRFPKDKLIELPKSDGQDVFQLSFSSSDPDWPYDVKIFELEISFPQKYPILAMKISLPEDQNLPETARRYVEVCIQDWLEEKERQNVQRGILTLEFRPFIRWLDRNLETIVTEGLKQLQRELMAKAAGMEFIPASQLKKEVVTSSPDGTGDDTGSDTDQQEIEFIVYKKDETEEVYTGPMDSTSDGTCSSEEEETMEDQASKNSIDLSETEVRGTQIKLRNLQLRESASTMVFQQIKLMIQCSRCHNRLDVKTPPNQVNAVSCQKCNQSQLVNFRAAMVHQFSSVIGYLDLEGCTAFDLVMQDCSFKLGCLECSKETTVQGLPPGQLIDVSCHTCHKKMKTGADSAKFTELQSSSIHGENAINIPVMKIKKIPKDPRIMLGNPLPDNGTCKHYKKSFRWFRFPCCGKVHPCDICHEDKENHEMVMANRMICGHCCKEQFFALEKPCVACHRLMTKSRSSFWEGGKGCRDKTKMSRDDVKKYTNTNKTVSRKAQEKTNSTKKKENK